MKNTSRKTQRRNSKKNFIGGMRYSNSRLLGKIFGMFDLYYKRQERNSDMEVPSDAQLNSMNCQAFIDWLSNFLGIVFKNYKEVGNNDSEWWSPPRYAILRHRPELIVSEKSSELKRWKCIVCNDEFKDDTMYRHHIENYHGYDASEIPESVKILFLEIKKLSQEKGREVPNLFGKDGCWRGADPKCQKQNSNDNERNYADNISLIAQWNIKGMKEDIIYLKSLETANAPPPTVDSEKRRILVDFAKRTTATARVVVEWGKIESVFAITEASPNEQIMIKKNTNRNRFTYKDKYCRECGLDGVDSGHFGCPLTRCPNCGELELTRMINEGCCRFCPEPGPPSQQNESDDWAMLRIAETDDIKKIKKAYHRMALIMHPDRGGDQEDFKQLANAFDRIMKSLEQQASDEAEKDRTKKAAAKKPTAKKAATKKKPRR